jgi:hypothetical protein
MLLHNPGGGHLSALEVTGALAVCGWWLFGAHASMRVGDRACGYVVNAQAHTQGTTAALQHCSAGLVEFGGVGCDPLCTVWSAQRGQLQAADRRGFGVPRLLLWLLFHAPGGPHHPGGGNDTASGTVSRGMRGGTLGVWVTPHPSRGHAMQCTIASGRVRHLPDG